MIQGLQGSTSVLVRCKVKDSDHRSSFGNTKRNSGLQLKRKCQKRDISCDTQRSQDGHNVPTGSKLFAVQPILTNLAEELLVALLPSEERCTEYACSVDGEQRTDTVEIAGENLEYDQGKAELAKCCADVCSC